MGDESVKWFRMYHEARTDGKLAALSDAQFRVWFRLMCYANEQETRGVIPRKSDRVMAVEVAGGDVELYRVTLDVLRELDIVDVTDEQISIVHWNKRQFESDNSTDRWHTWKNKRKANVGQTFDQQHTNVGPTVSQRYTNGEPTPPDTDTDKELKIHVRVRATEYTEDFLEFWEVYPRKVDKGAAFKQWKARIKEGTSPTDLILAARNYADTCKQLNTEERYIKHAKTFLGVSRSFEEYLTPSITEPPKQYIDPDLEEEMRFRAQVVSGTYEPH